MPEAEKNASKEERDGKDIVLNDGCAQLHQPRKKLKAGEPMTSGPDDLSVTLGMPSSKTAIWMSSVGICPAIVRIRAATGSASKFDRILPSPLLTVINHISCFQSLIAMNTFGNDACEVRGLVGQVEFPKAVVSSLGASSSNILKLSIRT